MFSFREKISLNFILFFPFGRENITLGNVNTKVRNNKKANENKTPLKLKRPNDVAPTKNPKPFMAFFEPVKRVTHLNNVLVLSEERSFIDLFALVFTKSFAIPETPWRSIN